MTRYATREKTTAPAGIGIISIHGRRYHSRLSDYTTLQCLTDNGQSLFFFYSKRVSFFKTITCMERQVGFLQYTTSLGGFGPSIFLRSDASRHKFGLHMLGFPFRSRVCAWLNLGLASPVQRSVAPLVCSFDLWHRLRRNDCRQRRGGLDSSATGLRPPYHAKST